MNLIKVLPLVTVFGYVCLPTAQAAEVTSLPTIKVMAESELREEVGVVPFQDDKGVRKALQRKIMKSEQDIQNYVIGDNIAVVDIQPKAAEPNLGQLAAPFQHYVLAVAEGLQSSDPTNGLFTMLKQVGIDRNNVEGVRNGTIKLNLDNFAVIK